MIPTTRLLLCLGALPVAGIVVAALPIPVALWWIVLGLVVAVAIVDCVAGWFRQRPSVERRVAGSLPLGVRSEIILRITNRTAGSLSVRVFDHFPSVFRVDVFPIQVNLVPNHWTDVPYRVVPEERGEHRFAPAELRVLSPWGLWWRRVRDGGESVVRVYPNFAAVANYALLACDGRLSQLGVVKRRRRGEGLDFHQLRDYHPGDSLRQVDWRKTSQIRKLISKEYQDERDQTVFFLLDCGRRMRSQDAHLSHFDQALNAVLLLAYVALRQGDAAGLGTFGGSGRWLMPVKGQALLNQLLNYLYDLQPSTEVPDYSQAALDLLARQRRHSLVVLVTNLRDEDADDLLAAARLLMSRHRVLVANLREESIDKVMNEPVENFGAALRLAGAHDYLQQRDRTMKAIRGNGVLSLDVPPAKLSLELVNAYLAIKAGGAL